jgi:NitT/TauT family transport system permease protein
MRAAGRLLASAGGLAVLAAGWELAGRTGALGPSWPPLSGVWAFAAEPEHAALLVDAAGRTGREALTGYAAGSLAGCGLAMSSALVPAAAPGLERFAALVNGIPVIAVGSLCAVTFPPSANPAIVAALATFFIAFVATVAGLDSPARIQRALFEALGASRARTFGLLELPAALPGIADGLRASAPVAVVGAIIGEWFASDRGLGPILVNAMQNYQIDLLWGAALAGAALAAGAYLVLGVLAAAAANRFRA